MHTLSFTYKKKEQVIQHPKWYCFWKRAKLVEVTNWDRVSIAIEYPEYECLKAFDNKPFEQYLRGFYGEIWGLQLTSGEPYETGYIKTEGQFEKGVPQIQYKVEGAQTNLIRYSEDESKRID
jgi:hypothetical protein